MAPLMIPTIIHYCWFGNNSKTNLINKCIASWSIYCPTYEIKEWNESTFDLSLSVYVQEALNATQYAFASDFVRAWVLFHYGGFYLDTDVELLASLDNYRKHEAVTGFEMASYPFTALWGARAGHSLARLVLDHYVDRKFNKKEPPNTEWVSRLISEKYSINPQKNEFQEGLDGLAVYPSTEFCVDIPITTRTATHHFEGSWLKVKNDCLVPYRSVVIRKLAEEIYLRSDWHKESQRQKIDFSAFENFDKQYLEEAWRIVLTRPSWFFHWIVQKVFFRLRARLFYLFKK